MIPHRHLAAVADAFSRKLRLSAAATILALTFAAPAATASVPVTGRFDLHLDSLPLFKAKFMYNHYHVQQSFAFDNQNGYLYVLQVEGTNQWGTFAEHSARGDLELTKMTLDGNTVVGHMYLRNFGHGVAMGVEPVAGSTVPWIWTEVDSVNARGQRIGRFRYSNGATLTNVSTSNLVGGQAGSSKYSLMSDTRSVTPSIDMRHNRLAIRYQKESNGQWRMVLFDLTDVKNGGTNTRLCDFALPAGMGTFQGWCTLGSYYYVLTGDANQNNARLRCINWNTGAIVEDRATAAFNDLHAREPEGVAYQLIGSDYRLCFGMGASVSSTDNRRTISIAYKDTIIP